MALGSAIGGLLGGTVGSVVPGVGTGLGASLGAGLGGGIEAAVKKKKASIPPVADQDQLALRAQLAEELRRRKTGVATEEQQQALAQQLATASKAAVSAGGGAAGATQSAIAGLMRKAGQSTSQLAQANDQQRAFYTNIFQNIVGNIAQRKQDIQGAQYAQLMAEAAQAGKESKIALLGALGQENPLANVGGSSEINQTTQLDGNMEGINVNSALLNAVDNVSDGSSLPQTEEEEEMMMNMPGGYTMTA